MYQRDLLKWRFGCYCLQRIVLKVEEIIQKWQQSSLSDQCSQVWQDDSIWQCSNSVKAFFEIIKTSIATEVRELLQNVTQTGHMKSIQRYFSIIPSKTQKPDAILRGNFLSIIITKNWKIFGSQIIVLNGSIFTP